MNYLYRLIIYFSLYSFVGWLYESTLYTITHKKFINRGFLNGPCCPIYGFGAIIDWLCLNKLLNLNDPVKTAVAIFFAGMALCCSLEYFTSWLLEKIFHARWWDYSQRRFNIKGRICLLGAFVFGIMSVVVIMFVHPLVIQKLDLFTDRQIMWGAIGLLIIFFIDTVATVFQLTKFNEKLKELQNNINTLWNEAKSYAGNAKNTISNNARAKIENVKSKLNGNASENENDSEIDNTVMAKIKSLTRREKNLSKNIYRSTRYNDAINKIRELLGIKKN
ncbi:MAG: putative ABC transporter permease [Clostridiales bacterium]|nr:putative ABC transporter permease [Clostridiales bacterium]